MTNPLFQGFHIAMDNGRLTHQTYVGFHKWGYPECMVSNGKCHLNGWFGGTYLYGNLHIDFPSTSSVSHTGAPKDHRWTFTEKMFHHASRLARSIFRRQCSVAPWMLEYLRTTRHHKHPLKMRMSERVNMMIFRLLNVLHYLRRATFWIISKWCELYPSPQERGSPFLATRNTNHHSPTPNYPKSMDGKTTI